ncbi:amidohydrolase family protein [Rubrivivax gelatinosus]|uniref:Amidohydrolase n=1 Tax=Rubrivivax gelatinosus TaxID=28068 RepID=A0ABS1E0C4_RUBGE|nr:amidohydrolase [Rubrivivax gelatinosus]
MSPLPQAIVDTHHHLWSLSAGCYPWLQHGYDAERFILGEYRALCRDYGPAELRRDIGALPVVASVHVEAERERTEALAETAWLDAVADAHGLPTAIVCWVDLLADDVEQRLDEQLRWRRVRGVRFKPVAAADARASVQGRPGSLQDPRWQRGLRALAERGLLWELRVPYWHLAEAATLVAAVPGLQVVVQHLGLPWDRDDAGLAVWRRGLQALAALPGVHLKLSELGLRDRPWRLAENAPLLADAVATFGAARCLFGSNFPVAGLRIGYGELVAATSQALAHLPDSERRAIWHDNAVALYRLPRR